jgi:hypothetical protein
MKADAGPEENTTITNESNTKDNASNSEHAENTTSLREKWRGLLRFRASKAEGEKAETNV